MTDPTSSRRCGECALCCTVLRVDELKKLAGTPCEQLGPPGAGCSIHATRPRICRDYRCFWLKGSLRDEDRPDRLGAVLDLVPRGAGVCLEIREAEPGAFDASSRLREIADAHRESMAVRVTDARDVMNPDRPFRVLLAGGEEQRVEGDQVRIYRDGRLVETRRTPWLERQVTRMLAGWRRRRLERWPSPDGGSEPPTAT